MELRFFLNYLRVTFLDLVDCGTVAKSEITAFAEIVAVKCYVRVEAILTEEKDLFKEKFSIFQTGNNSGSSLMFKTN